MYEERIINEVFYQKNGDCVDENIAFLISWIFLEEKQNYEFYKQPRNYYPKQRSKIKLKRIENVREVCQKRRFQRVLDRDCSMYENE